MVNNNVFTSADFTFVNDTAIIDDIETDNDTTYFSLTLGIKHSYDDTTDIYTAAAIESYQNDFYAVANGQSDKDLGYSLALGARKLLFNHLELHASTTRITYSGKSRWENMASIAYHMNRNLSWELSFIKNKYSNTFLVGAAFGF